MSRTATLLNKADSHLWGVRALLATSVSRQHLTVRQLDWMIDRLSSAKAELEELRSHIGTMKGTE